MPHHAFTIVTKNERNFSAQCCNTPFSLADAWPHLGESLANLYAEKRVEYNTEASSRVYCYKCEAFIRESGVEGSRVVVRSVERRLVRNAKGGIMVVIPARRIRSLSRC
jgi:hypothetical protein